MNYKEGICQPKDRIINLHDRKRNACVNIGELIISANKNYQNNNRDDFMKDISIIFKQTQGSNFGFYSEFESTGLILYLIREIEDLVILKLIVNLASSSPKYCISFFNNNIIDSLKPYICNYSNLENEKFNYCSRILSCLSSVSAEIRDTILDNFNLYDFISIFKNKKININVQKQVFILLYSFLTFEMSQEKIDAFFKLVVPIIIEHCSNDLVSNCLLIFVKLSSYQNFYMYFKVPVVHSFLTNILTSSDSNYIKYLILIYLNLLRNSPEHYDVYQNNIQQILKHICSKNQEVIYSTYKFLIFLLDHYNYKLDEEYLELILNSIQNHMKYGNVSIKFISLYFLTLLIKNGINIFNELNNKEFVSCLFDFLIVEDEKTNYYSLVLLNYLLQNNVDFEVISFFVEIGGKSEIEKFKEYKNNDILLLSQKIYNIIENINI